MARNAASLPAGSLHIERSKTEPDTYFWVAFWRDSESKPPQKKKRLGRAHVELRDVPADDLKGWQRTYRKRRGRPVDALSADDAAVRKAEVIRDYFERKATARRSGPVLFETVADEWLAHGRDVLGWKPSVERDYRAMLHAPERTPKARGRAGKARVMRRWKGERIDRITTEQVRAWLRSLTEEADPKTGARTLSARSVNKHRQVLGAICAYAVEHGYADENPVTKTAKRRQADSDELRAFSIEQVSAIVREAKDETTRALITTAAYSGLRMGELLALRWRDIDWTGRRIRVQRSYSQGLGIVSPKSRKARAVPLADRVAAALHGLRDREAPDALVFCRKDGGHIDPSTIRARYIRARDAAIKADSDLPRLRFHDLRHTFGTRAVSGGADIVQVKEWMGHADVKTTMVYLHHAARPDDAGRLNRAFEDAAAQAEALV